MSENLNFHNNTLIFLYSVRKCVKFFMGRSNEKLTIFSGKVKDFNLYDFTQTISNLLSTRPALGFLNMYKSRSCKKCTKVPLFDENPENETRGNRPHSWPTKRFRKLLAIYAAAFSRFINLPSFFSFSFVFNTTYFETALVDNSVNRIHTINSFYCII